MVFCSRPGPDAAFGGSRWSAPARPWPGGRPAAGGVRLRQDGSEQGFRAMCWTEVTELVRRAQAGDRHAFGELVTRFQGAVFAMALARVRDAGEAQELAQEVFVHAMRKLP